jgi:hypothetical protein
MQTVIYTIFIYFLCCLVDTDLKEKNAIATHLGTNTEVLYRVKVRIQYFTPVPYQSFLEDFNHLALNEKFFLGQTLVT